MFIVHQNSNGYLEEKTVEFVATDYNLRAICVRKFELLERFRIYVTSDCNLPLQIRICSHKLPSWRKNT